MKAFSDEWLEVWEGDCREVMTGMPKDSVHTVITSPPYYNLRDYGHQGQIGLEDSPDAYIEHMIEVGRAIRHVLRPDGIFWLNLGDSYGSGQRTTQIANSFGGPRNKRRGLPEERGKQGWSKQLIGIPWRVAFALQEDGWYLRRDVIWSKPNPMPESVEDRPTSSHEYIFMLTKNARYFYDGFAVKEPISEAMAAVIARGRDREYKHDSHNRVGQRSTDRGSADAASLASVPLGRSRRSVWNIATVSYPGAHYATFPPKLVEPMILSATSEQGVCSVCGAPSVRKTEESRLDHHETTADGKTLDGPYAAQAAIRNGVYVDSKTVGWERTCSHQAELVPATVLDPFAGSGTVGMVANRLSRRAMLIDINAEYIQQQMERNANVPLGL